MARGIRGRVAGLGCERARHRQLISGVAILSMDIADAPVGRTRGILLPVLATGSWQVRHRLTLLSVTWLSPSAEPIISTARTQVAARARKGIDHDRIATTSTRTHHRSLGRVPRERLPKGLVAAGIGFHLSRGLPGPRDRQPGTRFLPGRVRDDPW